MGWLEESNCVFCLQLDNKTHIFAPPFNIRRNRDGKDGNNKMV